MPEGNSPAAESAFRGLRNLAGTIRPWLIDVGSWIFGGLTAVNLIVMSALITVGPADASIKAAAAAFAAALPLNLAGIILLRLVKDLNDVGLDDLTLRAFQSAGFPDIAAYFPPPAERAARNARRSRVAIVYSLGIAALSSALTMIGMMAAVWHVGRWIAFVLLAMTTLSAALVAIAMARAWPPESDAEKALKGDQR